MKIEEDKELLKKQRESGRLRCLGGVDKKLTEREEQDKTINRLTILYQKRANKFYLDDSFLLKDVSLWDDNAAFLEAKRSCLKVVNDIAEKVVKGHDKSKYQDKAGFLMNFVAWLARVAIMLEG
ncbi:hypothetical protein EVAR_102345_1 [Eumeta japonica]|uniref:Uncharacterized protein n=1 Tax=Eumeta variegata TaxID=151549 RepID=A0A4C1XJ27_EUMVA|nr:hypothetical protein EVAR_102345_1 [Eumeta japonica]